jgi:hypothetical protein
MPEMSDINSTETISNPIYPGSKISVRGLWRDGERLVVQRNALVPARCLKCNQWTTQQPRSVDIKHFPSKNILMILLLAISPVTVISYHRVYLEVVLCRKHFWIERLSLVAGWLLVIGSFFVFVLSLTQGSMLIYILSVLMFVGGFALGLTLGAALSVRKVEGNCAWVSGACSEYLCQFPSIPSC